MKKEPRRRMRPRPMDLRYERNRQLIARWLLLGASCERIAKQLHVTARTVRYQITTPQFQELYARLQREHFEHLDRKMGRLLMGAVKTLRKMLKDSDWRARDAAVEKILKLHGRYTERFDLTGSVAHRHELLPADDMTPEQRTLARQLLQSYRANAVPRALPPALSQANTLDDDGTS